MDELNRTLTRKKIKHWRTKQAKQPGPGVLKRHNKIAEIVKRYYPKADAKILDIGGREGFLCDALKRQGFRDFYIIDISSEAIKFAKERGYQGEVMDGENVATLNKKFDIVVASHVLEHCQNPGKIVGGIYEVLNMNGIVFVEVPRQPKGKVPTKYGHWYLFSDKKELIALFDGRWELLHTHESPIRTVYRKWL